MDIKYKIVIIALIAILGFSLFLNIISYKNKGAFTASLGNFIQTVSAEEIYPMFVCPCCGQPLDKKNICCDAARDMIDYIDSQVAEGLSKDDVVIKTAEKYGMGSVVEAKRDEIKAKLANINQDLFPKENLSFKDAVGKKAPEFSLDSLQDKTVKLADYNGKVVVLFFNEGSMCYPACWDQIESLAKDARFNTDKITVFSIVGDQKGEWENIVKQVPELASAKLLFDQTKAVSSAYDVLSLPSSMHQGSFPGHTYFVIDKEGIVRYTLDDPNMAINNDKIFGEALKLIQ